MLVLAKIFGIEHISYLIIFIVICALAIFLTLKFSKKEKGLDIEFKIFSGLLLIFIILNRISICIRENYDWSYLIPDSFCGLTSLLFPLAVLCLKKDNIFNQFFIYI